ncbi:MAG: type Z 30S ribosomal protein S14 [Planctomycetes bacterium]|nr:type Z 30S ribosomal protein S14 [Planctomycetota bacterium]
MATKALRIKQQSEPKYKVMKYNRCLLCGRRRAYYRRFCMCRLCFRKLASEGKLPGVRKASW